MKAYKIIVNYNSGDSFNQYPNQQCECVHEWDNLDIAKENLKRIIEHNKAAKKLSGWTSYGRGTWSDFKNEHWYSKTYPAHSVLLLTDDNTEYIESCEWIGYFEDMNFCEVIPKNNDMRIDV